ncbi:MAG: sodium:proton antiporter NhaD [Bacteroidetes bacterium]|nr:sodium:proton antiporter NhaD [Bacteroidota bacterium]MBL0050192.1 sodium:proton antiporter NhaD [Bacteroidota bacterium]
MVILAVVLFILGYLAIAFEHNLHINKAAPALLTGTICWMLYFLGATDMHVATENLNHSMSDIAGILFFLLGAMTIVELIDSHHGFDVITQKINTRSKSKLLLIIGVLTFFLSAVLDNLTTAIVMSSLCTKLLTDKEDRLWFAGLIIIAANAGGAWTPIGDVTTTMLWIGNQITTGNIMRYTFLPSLVVLIVPMLLMMSKFKGQTIPMVNQEINNDYQSEKKWVLYAGIGMLIFVPIFKTVTHMPPFMGMMMALGFMWVLTSQLHKRKEETLRNKFSLHQALQRIDTPSILFFLGILLAVSSLEQLGILHSLASYLDTTLKNEYIIGTVLGMLSAVIDNVPLVAAAQGMYDLSTYHTDHHFWQFLALTAGTGGSCIIIGSAAGVAIMGLQNINFIWYLKKISWLATAGFFAGIATYILQSKLLGH